MKEPEVPVPDDELADLSDAEQVALIEETVNPLTPEDERLEQPPAPERR